MKKLYATYLSFLGALLIQTLAFSQAYQIKTYSVDNGITQPYVYTINQDKKGYLWAGTGDGACKFDGISFKSFYASDGFAENFVTASFKDNARNLWIGHNQGGITFYDGKTFKVINTSGFSKSPVTSIISDEKGGVWCATQNDGIFRISKAFEVDVFKMEFNQFSIFSIAQTKNNQLLVGTAEGLMLYDIKSEKRKPIFSKIIETVPETKIQCLVKKNNSGSFWVGTEDEGLFLLTPSSSDKNIFKAVSTGNNLPVKFSNVQDVYEDKLSNLWLATFGSGVVKLILTSNTLKYEEFLQFSEDNGLGNKYTKSIYADHEGNVWVGTYGSGLIQLQDNCFTFYSHHDKRYSNSVTSIYIDEKVKWFGVENGLIKIDLASKIKWEFFSSKNRFVDDKVTSIFKADSNNLIVGTDKHGAYRMNIEKNTFSKIPLSEDLLCQSINSITGKDDIIWIATKGGIFKLKPKITIHFTTESGLTHNNINQIVLGSGNKLWVATHSNYISYIDSENEVKNILIFNGTDLINVSGILEDEKKNIWVATLGNGVFNIKDTLITKYTVEKGLKSNYCYSIVRDGSNNIWVGHRLGLSRIKTDKNEIDVFDKEEGILGDCNLTSSFTDFEGYTWFGTTMGSAKFDPHKDVKNLIPPIVNVTSFKINDKEVDFTIDTVLPYDNYRLRIDFVGITFKSSTHIQFQYKLEGYDVDWSDKTNSAFAQYGKLSDGEYTFLLRAFNNDGVSNQSPFKIKIVIAPPIWKRAWFIILCIAIVIYGFYLVLKIRERNHRKFELQLQKALNEKTREVIFQKEEIEKKNKDITDSIRYAKRIQDAILPEMVSLRKIVPESFIFFQPRDIVSGDFYWFDRFGDFLIVVCADATGHGVPGAFMSMIGSTLLKEIVSRKGIDSPAFALALLDEEIKILLKQTEGEHHQTQDGVDVVICEINLKTHFVRIASTKRPVIISKDKELVVLKKESLETQQYETKDIQLSKGDTLYLFTDGYPDQFGGDDGKKIKISNVRSVLEQIQTLPIAK
ncbi:MAG TPA: two-component regulator propeller domain-containing protein, partial [Bacteroidia bacterium]|nr:two-component regulator propeller domain-containing protein [Bacteroidia bacterium]